jgi:hypothetical protein
VRTKHQKIITGAAGWKGGTGWKGEKGEKGTKEGVARGEARASEALAPVRLPADLPDLPSPSYSSFADFVPFAFGLGPPLNVIR